jgi:hypothetical protein
MKTILIMETDEWYFEQTKAMLDEITKQSGKIYCYAPKSENDFHDMRDNLHRLFSPKKEISDSAANFLNDKIQGVDLLLIEYNLSENNHVEVLSDVNNTAIDFYQKLNPDSKALIYANATSKNIENIKKQIGNAGLTGRVDVVAKPLQPDLCLVTPESAAYLRENIEAILRR